MFQPPGILTLKLNTLVIVILSVLAVSSSCLPITTTSNNNNNNHHLIQQRNTQDQSGGGGSSSIGSGVVDPLAQFHNLLREALKYVHSINRGGGGGGYGGSSSGSSSGIVTAPPPPPYFGDPARISGQVNVRNPRSGDVGDVTLKLYHLQEMDRKYGAKARPRFGKRNEVTQDNFIPMYEEDYTSSNQQQQQQPYGAIGDMMQPQQQQPLSLLFIP